MSKHTPGPWSAPLNDGNTTGIVWAKEPHGGVVATVSAAVQNPPDRAQASANARLIAAAPDLLASLRELTVAAPADGSAESAVYARARAAIAKAEA